MCNTEETNSISNNYESILRSEYLFNISYHYGNSEFQKSGHFESIAYKMLPRYHLALNFWLNIKSISHLNVE